MPSERLLRILLRAVGAVCALAVVPVFMPREWIAWWHEVLGFGPLPQGPVFEYLARSTSMFYAVLGAVLWALSLDVRQRARAITGVGVAMILCGMVLLSIDIRAAMPWWWTAGEGPFVVALGVAYLVLSVRASGERRAAGGSGGAAPGA